MLVGTELRSPPEMPLADEGRVVAVLPDERGNRRMAWRQPGSGRAFSRQRLLQPDFQPLRIASGDKRAPRRRADRRRGVGTRELDALLREPIEVGRLVIGAAVAAQIAVAQIVREDEEDVRPGTLRRAVSRNGTYRGSHRRTGGDLEKLATCDAPPHAAMLRKGSPGVNRDFEGQCLCVDTRSNITIWEGVRTRFTTNARPSSTQLERNMI